jgi:hypothetical protein
MSLMLIGTSINERRPGIVGAKTEPGHRDSTSGVLQRAERLSLHHVFVIHQCAVVHDAVHARVERYKVSNLHLASGSSFRVVGP